MSGPVVEVEIPSAEGLNPETFQVPRPVADRLLGLEVDVEALSEKGKDADQRAIVKARREDMARETVRAEKRAEAAAELQAEIPAAETLAELLADPPAATGYVVDGLMPEEARVLCVAARKTGKTTLRNELVRSFADGVPFLGRFNTGQRDRVTVIDVEMSRGQTFRWLADLGIKNADAITLVSLRGRAATFDIRDKATRAIWAEILDGSDVVILDCLRPILDALGLSENTDAGAFLVAFDALLDEAEVSEAVVIDHAGHGSDRARGDSRKEDWADAIWYLEMADRREATSERTFRAMGRDVEVAPGVLEFAAETRRLTYVPPTPDAAKTAKAAELGELRSAASAAVLEWVRSQNGIGVEPTKTRTETEAGEGLSRRHVRDAVTALVESGHLVLRTRGRSHHLRAVDPLDAVPLTPANPFADTDVIAGQRIGRYPPPGSADFQAEPADTSADNRRIPDAS